MESSDFKTQVLIQKLSVATGVALNVADALAARYEILDALGDGGMGLVYRVRDRETTEILALKLLRPEIARDPVMMQRFKDELRLAHRITHKNVCRIYDFNRIGDLTFITMEYVDGESLRAYLQRTGKMSVERVIDLARQIAAGLGEAHAQGVIHRDLKPENVMLARSGLAKLMDFGIARAFGGDAETTQTVIGTPQYMAPEQSQGRPIDQRADLYALGLILYECLAGRRAFSGATPVEIALKQLKERPIPPRRFTSETPPHIEAIVLRCLEKEPARRFASAAELLRALAQTNVTPRRSWPWRSMVLILVVGILAIAGLHRAAKKVKPVSQIPVPIQAVAVSADPEERRSAPIESIKPIEIEKQDSATTPVHTDQSNLETRESVRGTGKKVLMIQRAARRGNRDAQFVLGQMHEHGRGMTQDKVEAYVWYSRSAAAGSASARQAHERLQPELSASEKKAAEQRAREGN